MTGDTATTAPAPRWVCPTLDLDIKNVEWTAYEVKPGTPYHDEPSEMIPAGWYVLGYYDEHDDRDAPPITIKIEGAYDEHGCDRAQYLAWHLVGTLTPQSSRLRRLLRVPVRRAGRIRASLVRLAGKAA